MRPTKARQLGDSAVGQHPRRDCEEKHVAKRRTPAGPGHHPTPHVSVIIVTHNRKDDVKEAIESIQGQTYGSVEIVVVDNMSEDGTCAMLQASFPRITTISLPENMGPSAARNIGIDNSSGSVVFFLDDDAVLESYALERIVERLSGEPQLGVIVCKIVNCSTGRPEWRFRGDLTEYVDREFYLGDLGCEGATAVRQVVFERAGGWPSHLFQYSEGRDLSYRILDQGFRMLYYPDALAYHKSSPFPGVPREEISRRRMFLTVRNEIWIAWAYLPIGRALAETALKVVYYPAASLGEGTFRSCLNGILAGFTGLPHLLRCRRRPVRPETLAQMDHMLHGRIVEKPEELVGVKPVRLLSLLSSKLRFLMSS